MVLFSTLLLSMFSTMALIPILRAAAVRLGAGLDLPHPRNFDSPQITDHR